MDLITGQRTFYVGVSGLFNNADGIIDVPFRDSGGNLIKCNFIRVTANYGVDDHSQIGGWVAELSGVSHTGDMESLTISALNATVPASGICGFGGTLGHGAGSDHTWHGSNGQVATGIKIQVNNEYGTIAMGITYGNLFPLNTLRLEQSYDAGA